MGEIRRGPNFVYRSFQFKKPTDRAAAMAVSTDTVNPGLKYAKSFAGSNGCSVEIVLEFGIKPGGGLEITGSFPLESMAYERENAVRAPSCTAWKKAHACEETKSTGVPLRAVRWRKSARWLRVTVA